jgi:enoyl-CoA hydratase/carnithine racemase
VLPLNVLRVRGFGHACSSRSRSGLSSLAAPSSGNREAWESGMSVTIEQRARAGNSAEEALVHVLSRAMIASLKEALTSLASHPEIRVVVLAAEGKAFSAGHDLAEMGSEIGIDELRTLFASCTDLMLTIRNLPQPVIARVQGVATAAGCQLVAMCDLAIASSDARFAVSGINLGLFCATPSVALSRNVSQKAALEMLLTGDFIDAATACERGLVNRVVPVESLDAEIDRLTASIAAKSPAAIAAGKRLFYDQLELPIEAAYARASEVMACNAILDDAREGIARFTKRTR